MTGRHTAEQRAQEIHARVAAATPGPWSWNPSGDDPEKPRMFLEATGRDYRHVLKITWPDLLRDEDAEFIAHAREDIAWIVAEVERVTRENEAAHRALDDFDVPRDEPHFRSPYMLSGRIRWLRSHLVVDANQRAGRLIDEAQAAEAERASLREQNQQLRDLLTEWLSADPYRSDWIDFEQRVRAALGDGEQQ